MLFKNFISHKENKYCLVEKNVKTKNQEKILKNLLTIPS